MLELTPQQIAILERLIAAGFRVVAFPLYESKVGVRRADCGALLAAVEGAGMSVWGAPFWIVGGQPAVKVKREGRELFVFKKNQVDATKEREAELKRFQGDLEAILSARFA